ncbi:MAG: HEAT repeat domain-containing protein [Acidimicrobiales bacterium]|nr:HEAT repeat domain-containing protein [Acidimicrobiales bacterium]MCB9392580.1 HEAT repeat domain-containing protein [Acidimicrobiaceae bacterium]
MPTASLSDSSFPVNVMTRSSNGRFWAVVHLRFDLRIDLDRVVLKASSSPGNARGGASFALRRYMSMSAHAALPGLGFLVTAGHSVQKRDAEAYAATLGPDSSIELDPAEIVSVRKEDGVRLHLDFDSQRDALVLQPARFVFSERAGPELGTLCEAFDLARRGGILREVFRPPNGRAATDHARERAFGVLPVRLNAPAHQGAAHLIIPELGSADAERRALAARLLARTRAAAAVAALAPLIDDESGVVRLASIEGLGQLRNSAALPDLRRRLTRSELNIDEAVAVGRSIALISGKHSVSELRALRTKISEGFTSRKQREITPALAEMDRLIALYTVA